MEIRQYFLLFRKWAWLLILGGLLGGVSAYLFSKAQPDLYQTGTTVMVSAATTAENQTYSSYYDIQLAQSYAQIFTNDAVLQLLSEALGYPVETGQIQVQDNENSRLIGLTVSDGEAQRAADIANTLVEVFIDYNNNLQNARYQTTEDSLKTQIGQVEAQIAQLETEMSQVTQTTVESQRQQVAEQAAAIEALLLAANDDLYQVQTQIEGFIPTPAVTNTPGSSFTRPTATPVPVPTPTLSPGELDQFNDLQARRDQLELMRSLYQEAYGNLLVMNVQTNSDPALRQAQIQNTLALYRQIYSNLVTSYENVRLSRLRETPNVVQISKAQVPKAPIQPQPLRSAMLGTAVGVMLAGAIAFLFEYLDDTLKTPEDVVRALGLPVIGLIGELEHAKKKGAKSDSGVFVSENPMSPVSESFRTLRANLDFSSVDRPLRTLLVTSSSPSEGKTTIAVNLAAVIAQGDRRVVLLDADLRRPSVHRMLNVTNRQGLTNLLRDRNEIASVITAWGEPPMGVITSGGLPPNPSELLASDRMSAILASLKDACDIVVIDSPPVILSDAIALSPKVDGVLLVIEPGKTRIGPAQVMVEQLQRAGARIVGVALNPISRRNSHYYTKYGYYSSYYYNNGRYGHYTPQQPKKEPKTKPRPDADKPE